MGKQKGKGKKRRKSWHRRGESHRWQQIVDKFPKDTGKNFLPDAPQKPRRVGGKNRGDTAK